MPSKVILPLALAFALSGCIMWDAGYTENKPVSRYDVPDSDKLPITYSVTLKTERDDVFALPDTKSLSAKIEDALMETGVFSKVTPGAPGGPEPYHVDFSFHQAGVDAEQSLAVGTIATYTSMSVPTGEVFTFDGSAVLSFHGKPVCSTARAEEMRSLIWLPIAPLGLVLNSWTAWYFVETGSVNALCDAVAKDVRSSRRKEG